MNLKGRSIEERPKGIEGRAEAGHGEMDLVVGKGRACLLVMTERMKREEILVKLPSKGQASVKEALDRLERKHGKRFAERFKSITMDNGPELLDSEAIEGSCIRPG